MVRAKLRDSISLRKYDWKGTEARLMFIGTDVNARLDVQDYVYLSDRTFDDMHKCTYLRDRDEGTRSIESRHRYWKSSILQREIRFSAVLFDFAPLRDSSRR